MEIADPLELANLSATGENSAKTRLFAHPHGSPPRLPSMQREISGSRCIQVAVGPEGGFTSEEVSQLEAANWVQCSLGPRILRVEMAALSAGIAVSCLWQNGSPPSTGEGG